MASVNQSGWRRAVSGAVSKVAAQSTAADAEILRQLSDVFKELAHLSVDVGAVWRAIEDVKEKLDSQAALLSEVAEMLRGHAEYGDESLELLGRLLQSTRARLEVIEAGMSGAADH